LVEDVSRGCSNTPDTVCIIARRQGRRRRRGADCGPWPPPTIPIAAPAGTQETAADRTLPGILWVCAARQAKIMPAPITPLGIDRVFVPVFLPPNICQQSSSAVGTTTLIGDRKNS
jgi:hypothetical protein